ncbi:MAG: TaqI-like C-terminal specificity domain-containing protein [Bacteroides sp.]
MRGRDVRRWRVAWAGVWLVATHNGIPDKASKIDINEYPAVRAHLDQYWERLASRIDRGDTPYNLRSCAYWDDFSKPKIVYSEIVREPQFYLDTAGEYLVEATAFLLTGEHLAYLIKLLNSRVLAYIYQHFYAGGGLGEGGYRYKKAFLQQLPLPRYTPSPLCESIERGTEVVEDEILQLYHFTPQEAAYLKKVAGV